MPIDNTATKFDLNAFLGGCRPEIAKLVFAMQDTPFLSYTLDKSFPAGEVVDLFFKKPVRCGATNQGCDLGARITLSSKDTSGTYQFEQLEQFIIVYEDRPAPEFSKDFRSTLCRKSVLHTKQPTILQMVSSEAALLAKVIGSHKLTHLIRENS